MTADVLKNLDEALLVDYCKDNNAAAQKILYSRYVEGMMLVCRRYIVDPEDAKEVLMDSFFSFFKNITGFTYLGEGSTRAWLQKIVINQCLMRLRKKKNFFSTAKEAERYENADEAEGALEYLNAKEILGMIHSLPDGYRAVFNLYFFEDMSHGEIAGLLGISEGTSKSQLHRARGLLREKYYRRAKINL